MTQNAKECSKSNYTTRIKFATEFYRIPQDAECLNMLHCYRLFTILQDDAEYLRNDTGSYKILQKLFDSRKCSINLKKFSKYKVFTSNDVTGDN